MLNVTLNEKTAKLLENYRRSKKISREKALESILEEATQRHVLQQVLSQNWASQTELDNDTFEEDIQEIIKQDRAKGMN
jgi:galactokinase/mevalonate kinase-like predicted kinase